jgi:hypothetical protein
MHKNIQPDPTKWADWDWDWLCILRVKAETTPDRAVKLLKSWIRMLEQENGPLLGSLRETDLHGDRIRFRLLIKGVRRSRSRKAVAMWKRFGGEAKIYPVAPEGRIRESQAGLEIRNFNRSHHSGAYHVQEVNENPEQKLNESDRLRQIRRDLVLNFWE